MSLLNLIFRLNSNYADLQIQDYFLLLIFAIFRIFVILLMEADPNNKQCKFLIKS